MNRRAEGLPSIISEGLNVYYQEVKEQGALHGSALFTAINDFEVDDILKWLVTADPMNKEIFLAATPIPGHPIDYVSEAFFDGLYAVLEYHIEQRNRGR